jgi:trimethylamine corrinoid protein
VLEKTIIAYNEAVFDTDRERAIGVIQAAVDRGLTPEEIVFQVVIPALERMIKSISEDFDANLAQHYMASQIAAEVTEAMIDKFDRPPEVEGHVVIGTASGDLHTLGKRIVTGCVKSLMIGVTDLGVNVAPERFVDEAESQGAQVIAISAMMLHTARGENGCLRVRELLKERSLEGRIALVVGGAPYRFDPNLYRIVGADAWSADGVTAGHVIRDLIRGQK